LETPGTANEGAFRILVSVMLAFAGAILALFHHKKWY